MGLFDGKCDICGVSEANSFCIMSDRWDKKTGKRSSVNACFCRKHPEKEWRAWLDKEYAKDPNRDDDINCVKIMAKELTDP